jgi:hypothetical protein
MERLLQILSETEKRLLDELAIAAQLGDLIAVDRARAIVGQIRHLAAEITPGNNEPSTSKVNARKVPERKAAKVNQESVDYPRFSIRNGTLYRLAWSRKKQSEYEHRVPKPILELITNAMSGIADPKGLPVQVDQIVNAANRLSAIQIPQYQVYLVVGWLRHTKCIKQVGRDGYLIPAVLAERAQQEWNLLSSKQG